MLIPHSLKKGRSPAGNGRCRGGRPQGRVLRGGAFNNNRQNVRCAYRNRNHPTNRNNNVGFRVLSHGIPALGSLPGTRALPVFRAGHGLRGENGGRCGRFPAEPRPILGGLRFAGVGGPGIYQRGPRPTRIRRPAGPARAHIFKLVRG